MTQRGAGPRACAYPPAWRLVAALLITVSRASLPAILVLVLLVTDPPVTPPVLVRLVLVLAVLPGLAARLIGRLCAADLEVGGATLVVQRRGLRLEIPHAAVERVLPWVVPLPGPGFSLRMRSGRLLRWGLQTADPGRLLLALADAGVTAARDRADHPSVLFEQAKQPLAPRRWYHLAGRFPLFGLAPTALLFNVHQHIAYGGLLGEYYLLGLAAYLQTFAVYWVTVTIYLVLYASVWRVIAEGASLAAAWVAPSRAARVRQAAEIAVRVLYYGGVPVLLAIRFLV